MNPLSVDMLKTVMRMAAEARSDRSAIIDIVRWVLDVEGVELEAPEPVDPEAARREAARVRKERSRAKRDQGVTAIVTDPVTEGVTKRDMERDQGVTGSPSLGLSPSPVSSPSLENHSPSVPASSPSESDSQTARPRVTSGATDAVTDACDQPRDSVRDKPFALVHGKSAPNGMATDGWREGVRTATGRPYTGITHGVRRSLEQALTEHCPAGEDIVAWAKAKGAEFAQAHKGADLSPFKFISWLNSGCIEPSSGVMKRGGHVPQPVPDGGSIWKEGT